MAVRNYTIGDPSQPGKMVVLNGNLDVYATNGTQTINNGRPISPWLGYSRAVLVTSVPTGTSPNVMSLTFDVPAVDTPIVMIAGTVEISGTASTIDYILTDSSGNVLYADMFVPKNTGLSHAPFQFLLPATFIPGSTNNTVYLVLDNTSGVTWTVVAGANFIYAQLMNPF